MSTIPTSASYSPVKLNELDVSKVKVVATTYMTKVTPQNTTSVKKLTFKITYEYDTARGKVNMPLDIKIAGVHVPYGISSFSARKNGPDSTEACKDLTIAVDFAAEGVNPQYAEKINELNTFVRAEVLKQLQKDVNNKDTFLTRFDDKWQQLVSTPAKKNDTEAQKLIFKIKLRAKVDAASKSTSPFRNYSHVILLNDATGKVVPIDEVMTGKMSTNSKMTLICRIGDSYCVGANMTAENAETAIAKVTYFGFTSHTEVLRFNKQAAAPSSYGISALLDDDQEDAQSEGAHFGTAALEDDNDEYTIKK